MISIIKLLKENNKARIKFLFTFILLIYFPILLNTFVVYNRTLSVIKKERNEYTTQIIKKTSQSINLTIKDVIKEANNFSNHNAIRKSLEDYNSLGPSFHVAIDEYINLKMGEIIDKNNYIEDIICVSVDGNIFSSKDTISIDLEEFNRSSLKKELSSVYNNQIWNYDFNNTFFKNLKRDEVLFLAKKMVSINGDKTVGYVFFVIDSHEFKTLYDDISFSNMGQIAIYDTNKSLILSKLRYPIGNDVISKIVNSNDNNIKEITANNEKYSIGTENLPFLDWHLISIVPIDEVIEPIRNELKESLGLVIFVGLIISIWIVIEILLLSKLAAEKEMAKYKLMLSEEMNEKLRIYKHDFMNHLQIIQGLIELDYPKRALEYIRNIIIEGRNIKFNYEIGIPEIESTILSYIALARENNIDIEIEAIKLDSKLEVNIYDLTKILTNLLKNAVHALINTDSKYKKLTVKIYEELDDYVFEVTNNVPIIPREIRNEIFKRGYTTKENEGSGLGLYIVKELTNKNNGHVELKVDEHGNHFIIRFPQRL